MLEFKEAKKYIEEANKIYIVGHINPDGDAIGSGFALYLALKKVGKDVSVILPKRSEIFDFLPHIDDAKSSIIEDEIDLLITVDASDIRRLALPHDDIKKAKNILMIDHHKKSNPYGIVNVIDETMPATCQIIYELIEYLGIEIDVDIASYIYAGIISDTGSFNYSTTNERTLEIASKLVGLGINFSYICKKLNDTIKESKLKLIAIAINNMEVYDEGKIRYTYIDYDTISGLGVDEEDAEGMTNYLRMVEGTEVAVYVRQKSDGSNKVSLRSGDIVDVSTLAIIFGGGGHKRASGYTMTEDLPIAKQKLIDEIRKLI